MFKLSSSTGVRIYIDTLVSVVVGGLLVLAVQGIWEGTPSNTIAASNTHSMVSHERRPKVMIYPRPRNLGMVISSTTGGVHLLKNGETKRAKQSGRNVFVSFRSWPTTAKLLKSGNGTFSLKRIEGGNGIVWGAQDLKEFVKGGDLSTNSMAKDVPYTLYFQRKGERPLTLATIGIGNREAARLVLSEREAPRVARVVRTTPPSPVVNVSPQQVAPQSEGENGNSDYSVIRRYLVGDTGLGMYICVSPQQRNNADLSAVGSRLRREFKDTPFVLINVFDDRDSANLAIRYLEGENMTDEMEDRFTYHRVAQYRKNSNRGLDTFDTYLNGFRGEQTGSY